MKILVWIIGLGVGGAFVISLYARLAPITAADWHVAPEVSATETLSNGYKARVSVTGSPEAVQAQLTRIALGAPRTKVLAEEAGLVTFITRTAGFGFPDFTTVSFAPEDGATTVQIFARLKYGKADLGVNQRRVQGWIAQLSDI